MSLSLAIQDLAQTLSQSRFLDRVDGLPIETGSRKCTMTITPGTQLSETNYGKTRTKQTLILKLTIKTAITPDQLAEITREIDRDIIKDRRRNQQAQTTVLSEDGWEPEEAEGKGQVVTTRECEVHYYEDSV